ncbi:MAG TPA: crossover junction endodeoxyribonuclease RuvC [Fibrobacteraceae bacterium]|jgi:crossover junction endodeoxyribonuclease RuvC|nr:crossover junction endodeoxyribonuclease RuvC [Fibrobacter sp.]HPW94026.1 crossover junction endodeoxyribonuclease RuvC [Fibrobacteraceae bacterium]
MVILGIDPGSHTTGYAFLETAPQWIRVLEYGCIRASSTKSPEMRLLDIITDLEALINQYKPTALSMEGIFFAKNIKSALLLGHVRGAILAICLKRGMTYHEYSPKSVKLAVTGSGSSSKERVCQMVQVHLQLKEIKGPLDASDALAIAWTHAHPVTTVSKPACLVKKKRKNQAQEWRSLLKKCGGLSE